MYCSSCGKNIAVSAKFCSGCGQEINLMNFDAEVKIKTQIQSVLTYEQSEDKKIKNGKGYAELIYLLYALSFILVLPAFLGIFIAYSKVNDFSDSYLGTHFKWQIRTFWNYFILLLILIVMIFFPLPISGSSFIGKAIACAILAIYSGIWVIYRIAVGWIRLSDENEIS